jgi:hypothetical protein
MYKKIEDREIIRSYKFSFRMGNPIHVLNPMGTGWEKSLLHCKMGMG